MRARACLLVASAFGQQLYYQYCNQCHPGGDGGLGPALNNKPAPAIAIRTQIRHGLGAMPSFHPQELSDDDVDAIVEYVFVMRRHPEGRMATSRTPSRR
jgi:mono/diheme cytochrome c family protein